MSLDNDGNVIQLRNPTGGVVDTLAYDSSQSGIPIARP